MLAMVVNDDDGHLTPRGACRFFREHARSYRRAVLVFLKAKKSAPTKRTEKP